MTINGIGERAGNASLEEVCSLQSSLYKIRSSHVILLKIIIFIVFVSSVLLGFKFYEIQLSAELS